MAAWRALGVVASLALALVVLAACAAISAAADGCAEMGMSVARCQAIVDDARRRLIQRPPVAAIAVEDVGHGSRDTLRSQQLVAVVRFGFVDGTEARIEVFCNRGNARTLVCTEHPSAT
jgi:hypothetical protein